MDALGINAGFLIGQFVNFGVFALIMWLMAWKPLLKMLDDRREKIAKGLEDARVAEEARANAEADAEKILSDARSEAQKIISEARSSAEERARPIIEAAERDADKIRSDARERAEEAQANALSGVRGQVVSLSIAAAHKLIGDALGDKKQAEKVVNDFFSTAQKDISGLTGNVTVTTALPLSDDEKKKIENQVAGTVTDWKVDPSILGGVVVRSENQVVDGSVVSNLSSLQATLN